VALGDSTTAGTPNFLSPLESPPHGSGDITSQYAYWLMREHPEWEVLNRGINGQRSDEIRERFERDVTAVSPRVVVILAGVNDVYQGYPVTHVQDQLMRMYARAHELGIRVVAGSVLPYDMARETQNQEIHELNAWLAGLGSPVHFCDTHKAVQDVRDADHLRESPEGLHPTPKGYHRMAVALKSVLARLLNGA
jgi:lysophospholipase L1-like esterase